MASTAIAATLDRDFIRTKYRYTPDPTEGAVADLTFKLFYQFQNSAGTQDTVLLETIDVLGGYLRVTGQAASGEAVAQETEVIFANPRYRTGLSVEVSGIRQGSPVVMSVPVHDGYEERVQELPSNPVRTPEFQENEPVYKLESPVHNIVETIPPVQARVYSLAVDGLKVVQEGHRYVPTADDLSFTTQGDVYTVENSTQNLLTNPLFSGSASASIPQGFSIQAPGFIVSSNRIEGPIADTYQWRVRASNPNFLNAYDNLDLLDNASMAIPLGLDYLTYSVYYRLESVSQPISSATYRWQFFSSTDVYLGQSTDTQVVNPTSQSQQWQRVSFTGVVPNNAAKVVGTLSFGPTESTDYFVITLYLPQMEVGVAATSFTPTSRVADVLRATGPITFSEPVYVMLETTNQPGMRGLLDTTTNGLSGFQWFTNNGILAFKIYDGGGIATYTAISPPFVAPSGNIRYGLAFTGGNLVFYLNDSVYYTQVLPTYSITATPIVGSLFSSNTAINNTIWDFRVTRVLP